MIVIILSIYLILFSFRMESDANKFTLTERLSSLLVIWPSALLVIFVMAVIYLGVATSTEAAALGAFGSLIIGLILKRLNLKSIIDSLKQTVYQTTMIFTIVIGGYLFSYFITMSGLGNAIVKAISESGFSKWTILLLIILFYLLVGMFMDMVSSMLLTIPIVYPVILNLGFDGIWFGVILVILLEIGLVTPPVGINLYVVSGYSGISLQKVFYGSLPFLGILLLSILILIIFPQIVLYLPSRM